MMVNEPKKLPHLCCEQKNSKNAAAIIFEHTSCGRWQRLKTHVCLHKSAVRQCSSGCSPTCKSKHSILHYACQFRPPLSVIKCLYKAYPQSIYDKDCKDRYALHIACKHGCSPDVIKFLLQKNSHAAGKWDIKERTPFLLAFKSYVSRNEKRFSDANKDLIVVANELNLAAPRVVLKEDILGKTALEYAIEKELHYTSIVYVQDQDLYEKHAQSEREKRKSDDTERSSFELSFEELCIQKHYVMPKGIDTNDNDIQKPFMMPFML